MSKIEKWLEQKKTSGILSPSEQRRLSWYFQWSQGDLSQMISGFASISSAELRIKMIRPPPTDILNDYMHIHPSRNVNPHAYEIEDELLGRVDDERTVRKALEQIPKEIQEELVLAFVLDVFKERVAFGQWGNLADRTTAAYMAYKTRRRKVSMAAYLSRISLRARARGFEKGEVSTAIKISKECEDRAVKLSEVYRHALDGVA